MFWRMITIIMMLASQSIATEPAKTEEPTIIAGMSYQTVVNILHERSFEKLSEKKEIIDHKNERTLRYAFKPRNDITPIHPSWKKSQIEFIFVEEQLNKINWYKKNGTTLELNMKKIYLGPK
jgi:hypothetical protein